MSLPPPDTRQSGSVTGLVLPAGVATEVWPGGLQLPDPLPGQGGGLALVVQCGAQPITALVLKSGLAQGSVAPNGALAALLSTLGTLPLGTANNLSIVVDASGVRYVFLELTSAAGGTADVEWQWGVAPPLGGTSVAGSTSAGTPGPAGVAGPTTQCFSYSGTVTDGGAGETVYLSGANIAAAWATVVQRHPLGIDCTKMRVDFKPTTNTLLVNADLVLVKNGVAPGPSLAILAGSTAEATFTTALAFVATDDWDLRIDTNEVIAGHVLAGSITVTFT